MSKKDIVLVGAGSGIAPYLPILEEIIRFDRGKSHNYQFDSATLVFIAREGEQISWLSNYLFHLLSSDNIKTTLNIKIFITLKKDLETLPSFLFWRALLLTQRHNIKLYLEKQDSLKANQNSQSVDMNPHIDNSSNDQSPLQDLFQNKFPVSIKFGRPDFLKLFKHIASVKKPIYNVYA